MIFTMPQQCRQLSVAEHSQAWSSSHCMYADHPLPDFWKISIWLSWFRMLILACLVRSVALNSGYAWKMRTYSSSTSSRCVGSLRSASMMSSAYDFGGLQRFDWALADDAASRDVAAAFATGSKAAGA